MSRKKSDLELYNSEGQPYKKKDKVPYYYADGKLVEVPKLSDPKDAIINYLTVCMDTPVDEIQGLWDTASSTKQLILDGLEELKKEHEQSGEGSKWQSISYAKAIRELKKIDVPIVSGDQAKKIKGIGKGIAGAIDEIIRSGRLKPKEERDQAKIERSISINLFMSIWGVNKKMANSWYAKGYRRADDIPEGELTEDQKVGIKYMNELTQPTTKEMLDSINKWLQDNKAKITSVGKLASGLYLTGDYRRGADKIYHISLVISSMDTSKSKLKQLIGKLSFVVYAGDVHSKGDVFYSEAIIKISDTHRRMDITLVPSAIIGAVLISTTGPDAFVVQLKEQAAQLGYRLSGDGLFKISGEEDEKISAKEEKIFEILGMDYVLPEDRF
jgi:DNA polymerase/3'-5' exonuclease PolX